MMIIIRRRKLYHIIELYVKSPCLHPLFGPPFTPYPLFQWYPQENDIIETFMFSEESPKNELTVVAHRSDEDCSKMWDRLNATFGPRANIHEGLKKPQENDS
jgi:hypothetical protein